MKIALGSDHAGFAAKQEVKFFLAGDTASTEAKGTLKGLDIEVVDLGCFDEDSCDYPDFARKVAQGVASGEFDRGILVCGSGIGMSIAANRFRGVRAALCYGLFGARLSRRHNDANVLCLGGRITGPELIKEIVLTWLTTPFEGGRHSRRVEIMDRA